MFLDEIGDLSPALQAKLLRVIQEKTFERVGGNKTIRVDVRVISATHQDLEQSIQEGRFRQDLYFRLNVVSLFLPPLRERREDIPLLIDHFLKKFRRENNNETLEVSKEARELLLRYPYPGNVRELENLVERAVVLCRGPLITSRDLPFHLKEGVRESTEVAFSSNLTLPEQLEELEKHLIHKPSRRQAEFKPGPRKNWESVKGCSVTSFKNMGFSTSPKHSVRLIISEACFIPQSENDPSLSILKPLEQNF